MGAMQMKHAEQSYFLSDFFAEVSGLAFLSLPSFPSLLSLLPLLSAPSEDSLLDSDFPPDSEFEDEPERFA